MSNQIKRAHRVVLNKTHYHRSKRPPYAKQLYDFSDELAPLKLDISTKSPTQNKEVDIPTQGGAEIKEAHPVRDNASNMLSISFNDDKENR